MTIRTPVCDLLGVGHPVGNAGMGSVAGPELCAAVAEAGGIGTLALGTLDAADAVERVAAVRAATSKPFSVNFIIWMLERDPSPLDAVLDAGVRAVTLSFGDPGPFVERVHAAGAMLLQQVQTVEGAARAASAGADVLIAQGHEAGGHTGTVPLMPLLPQVVDVASGVPVLAAGGIGDGRGLAAALALGAQGALLGTRFIVANEASSDLWPSLGEQVIAASSNDTVWSDAVDIVNGGGRSRWPAGIAGRSIRTPFLDRWAGNEHQLTTAFADAPAAFGPAEGEERDPTPAYAGPIAGMITSREPAADIVQTVMTEATDVLRRLTLVLTG